MSRHNCPAASDPDAYCARCERAISAIEDARNGADFDPSGRMADLAADRYESYITGGWDA